MLDRTERRILGVLLEKELAVPDSYPLTGNTLLAGCNQKSNRQPEMSLELFELDGALLAMQINGWIIKTEGNRTPRYRHEVAKKLGLDAREQAVLAELLLRGPQASGALKTRVTRMGCQASSPAEIEAVLMKLRDRPDPLVALLPQAPRERDARWTHLLTPADEVGAEIPAAESAALPTAESAPVPAREAIVSAPHPPLSHDDFEERLVRFERELAALRQEVRELRALLPPGSSQSTTTEL